MQIIVRRLFGEQLDDGAAETPDVARVRNLLLFLNNFWCHPVRSAGERHVIDGYLAAFALVLIENGGDAEIRQLDLAVLRREDVAALDIPVYNIFTMQEIKALQHLFYIVLDETFWNFAKLFDQGVQRAILDVLEYNVQMVVLALNTIQILYNLRVLKILQKVDFIFDSALLIFFNGVK